MPRSKKASKPVPGRKTRQSTRQTRNSTEAVPDVYQEMLVEAAYTNSTDFAPSPRPNKRRKVSEVPEDDVDGLFESPPPSVLSKRSVTPLLEELRAPQVVYDDFEQSDESDVEFEDVELEPAVEGEVEDQPEQKSLRLDLSKSSAATPKRLVQRRKTISKADRDLRIAVHKWHLLCLLLHLACRNTWCENEEVHAILKPLVPRKVVSLLHVDESQPQYQRSHSFNKGIEEVCSIWKSEWRVTARGLRRAYWKEYVDAVKESEDAEDPVDFEDFRDAADERSGSRDLGAQLFCALLRSVAIEARLVCSLQVLPFSSVTKGQTPEKPKSDYVHAPAQNYNTSRQQPTTIRPQATTPRSKKRVIDSPYPTFWVEVFSSATSTWIPLDPLVRNTINKPKTGFEPSASDELNSMSYVIAFEDDNTAKDVTRRYAQWYNAKTRKTRVESTKGGEEWWKRTMRNFRKRLREPRDEVDDAELLRRAANEGMPRNVQDFKGHPVYVLERHLRMSEVIHPRREVGKVSTGVGKNAKLESVYRRQDVHFCRTADAWYRRGREVLEGEQPLKMVVPKIKRGLRGISLDEEEEEEPEGVALYAEYQTGVYEPPPVVDGRIPKNAYRNLDVYVSSMIPAGAIHVRHPMASKAAKVLGIDYADAVTGFEFKGRQGTAIVHGVVVGAQFAAAIIAVIDGIQWQGTQEIEAERSRIVLALWKRMLTALRVRQKIEQEYGDAVDDDSDPPYEEDDLENGDGGFMPEATGGLPDSNANQTINFINLKKRLPAIMPEQAVHHPILIIQSPHKLPQTETTGREAEAEGLFTDDAAGGEGGGFMPEGADRDEGGGFIANDADCQMGGGFVREEAEDGGGGEGFTAEYGDSIERKNTNGDVVVSNEVFEERQIRGVLPVGEDYGEAGGGGFLLEDEDMGAEVERSSSQSTTANRQDQPTFSGMQPSRMDGTRREKKEDPIREGDGEDAMSETSLLSRDPEEDDADPEWLLDAIDE